MRTTRTTYVTRTLAAMGMLAALVAAPATAGPPSVIRTGGPSAPGDAKIAIVATRKNLAGSEFTVTDGAGTVVLTGSLAPTQGTSKPWKRAFAADLSAITTPGSYVVNVGNLSSAPWVVAEGAHREPIRTILRFFAAQNDGTEPSPLHGPSHLNDSTVVDGAHAGQHVDLTGGWMDAGNQVKFVTTTGFTVMILEAAARLDPVLAPELTAVSDVGVRWLRKAHPLPDLFVVQIGDQRDSDRGFADPAADDASTEPGIGTRDAYATAGADQAGKAAAALAYAALRASGDERTALIQAAREWYEFGSANPAHGTASPLDDFYESESVEDDMAIGAAALWRATGEAQFLADALDYLDGANLTELNWNESAAFAAADLCGGLGLPAVDDPAARTKACEALRQAGAAAAEIARGNAFATPGPPAFGQTAENGGAGAMAAIAGRLGVLDGGLGIAAGARDFLLGRNPWAASFVVGFGPQSPQHPHHWWQALASPTLPVGAVVGGPTTKEILRNEKPKLKVRRSPFKRFNSRDFVYDDNAENYVTSEPALDYAAASLFLLATVGSGN